MSFFQMRLETQHTFHQFFDPKRSKLILLYLSRFLSKKRS
ncbi:hypothetical protein LEP1GSC123_0980 [Leptospira borgpetersenii str. 200701203]|uniref:Uncharacterized protein n=2 Tax=Leptospira borgpetersenii TaxID=174 RepID=M3GJF7_LEPBO|nr:hypothetical protein LEP1GSC123_0980 [Leptospira borgpetersenii str. 200701203]EMN16626.1 hypothetical protein LEP1GSC056_3792 [Leptospira borgpetersenii str. Brem 328]